MISAITEIAEKKDTLKEAHTLTANYLKACSMIFENGILSHEKITSMSSTSIANMTEGMKWFYKWKELQQEPGTVYICIIFMAIMHASLIIDIKFRSPLQKAFLAWQVMIVFIAIAILNLC